MTNKEIAIKFLKDKQKKLVKNFQTDIFSLENTGEYFKYKTDENYFKALALSKGIDEILSDLKVLEVLKRVLKDNIKIEEYVSFDLPLVYTYELHKKHSMQFMNVKQSDIKVIKEWLENE